MKSEPAVEEAGHHGKTSSHRYTHREGDLITLELKVFLESFALIFSNTVVNNVFTWDLLMF